MVKKSKKRGVKPGTKQGKYKRNRKPKTGFSTVTGEDFSMNELIKKQHVINEKHSMEFPFNKIYSPAPVLTLCGQLEDAILLLENRISNAITKINSLM